MFIGPDPNPDDSLSIGEPPRPAVMASPPTATAPESLITETFSLDGAWGPTSGTEQATMSQATTPDLARSLSGDDDSACVGRTPSDTFSAATSSRQIKDVGLSFPFGPTELPQSGAAVQASDEDEASHIHDIDLLFGDGPLATTEATASNTITAPSKDVEPSGPATTLPHAAEGTSSTTNSAAATTKQPQQPLLGGLVLPQGDGSSRPQVPIQVTPRVAAEPTRSAPSRPANVGQRAVVPIAPAPPGFLTANRGTAARPAALAAPAAVASALSVTQTVGLSSTTTAIEAMLGPPPKRPRGRPPKYPRPDGTPAPPKKPAAAKRKASATEGGTAPKKAVKVSSAAKGKGKAAAVPVSIADLGRMIPKSASPEAIQAFIQKHVQLFADLFMALQKQASDGRTERERAKDELKGTTRSRSVGAAPATTASSAGIAAAENGAPASMSLPHPPPPTRGQSAPPPLLPLGTSTGPGLFSPAKEGSGSSAMSSVQSAGLAAALKAPSGPSSLSIGDSTVLSTSLSTNPLERDFSQVVAQAVADATASSAVLPAKRANSISGTLGQVASGSTSGPASKRRRSETNSDLRGEVEKRMTEIASGHDSLREEMLRLKVDKQFFDNAQKTVEERIQVLRDRIAARSQDLYREREANRKAREEARQVKKDRKAAERLKDAERTERRLEAQHLMIEAQIATEEEARREREREWEEVDRLDAEAEAGDEAQYSTELDSANAGAAMSSVLPIPAALDSQSGPAVSQGQIVDEAELAAFLGISLTDLSNYTQPNSSCPTGAAAAPLPLDSAFEGAQALCATTSAEAPAAEKGGKQQQQQGLEPMDLSHLLDAPIDAGGAGPAEQGAEGPSLEAMMDFSMPDFDLGALLAMGVVPQPQPAVAELAEPTATAEPTTEHTASRLAKTEQQERSEHRPPTTLQQGDPLREQQQHEGNPGELRTPRSESQTS